MNIKFNLITTLHSHILNNNYTDMVSSLTKITLNFNAVNAILSILEKVCDFHLGFEAPDLVMNMMINVCEEITETASCMCENIN